jgi:hypothetical protein
MIDYEKDDEDKKLYKEEEILVKLHLSKHVNNSVPIVNIYRYDLQ